MTTLPTLRTQQQGVALVMALVFLTLLTIMGITSMSTSSLEEKMANNTRDRNLAFQAAETALAAAESWLAAQGAHPLPWPDNASGRYNPSTTDVPVWNDEDIWRNSDVAVVYPCTPTDADPDSPSSCAGVGKTLLGNVATQPRYIIEDMGPISSTPVQRAYRITARGTGGTNSAVVMLQSTYIKQY